MSPTSFQSDFPSPDYAPRRTIDNAHAGGYNFAEVKDLYKTVLFDFDGTVFDTGEGIMKSVQYAAEAFGYHEPDWRALRSFVGPPLVESFARRYGVDAEKAAAMCAKYRERYAEKGIDECRVYPGVIELVRFLRTRGIKSAVATGKPTPFTVDILSRHGVLEDFDAVLGSEFDGTRGQKWEVITELLKRFGREGAVMVGDRDNDVRGALRCDIPCIGVSWGYAEPGELEAAGAVCVASDTDELKNILMR